MYKSKSKTLKSRSILFTIACIRFHQYIICVRFLFVSIMFLVCFCWVHLGNGIENNWEPQIIAWWNRNISLTKYAVAIMCDSNASQNCKSTKLPVQKRFIVMRFANAFICIMQYFWMVVITCLICRLSVISCVGFWLVIRD